MTTSNDLPLLDTNILVYAADELSPFHVPSSELRDKGRRGELALCVTPQMLFEFYAVITDPKRVNQPLDPADAIEEITLYRKDPQIRMISQGPDIVEQLAPLLKKHKIRRQEIFDALIVATMLSNAVKRIYTYNVDHFSKFDEIEVLTL